MGKLLCTLVIYLWLHTDVNSYRIRSFVVAQECPRIDGVRRLMAYSTSWESKAVVKITKKLTDQENSIQ